MADAITIEQFGDISVARIAGSATMDELTISAIARRLEAAVAADGKPKLVVNMSHMPYISSSMIRVLMSTSRKAKARGGEVRLAGVTPPVLEVLKITRLDTILPLFNTTNDALAGF